jgi:hypothetical protein
MAPTRVCQGQRALTQRSSRGDGLTAAVRRQTREAHWLAVFRPPDHPTFSSTPPLARVPPSPTRSPASHWHHQVNLLAAAAAGGWRRQQRD